MQDRWSETPTDKLARKSMRRRPPSEHDCEARRHTSSVVGKRICREIETPATKYMLPHQTATPRRCACSHHISGKHACVCANYNIAACPQLCVFRAHTR